MALHDDLLAQAKHLATKEPQKPRQASLRRATSTAYYALFHLLVADGARALAATKPPGLRLRIGRAFGHGDMKAVCQQFASGGFAPATSAIVTLPVASQLEYVARTFVTAQEARHDADYDTSKQMIRLDVLTTIASIEQAFADWKAVRNSPNAKVFMTALLLQKHWGK